MATCKFVRKTSTGGAGNFSYEYSCFCSGEDTATTTHIISANDNEARLLAQLECHRRCGKGKLRSDGLQEFDHPILEGGPVLRPATTEFWSRLEFVYWENDKLWGYWNHNRDLACGANMPGFFWSSEIESYDLTAGVCPEGVPTAGQPLAKVVRKW